MFQVISSIISFTFNVVYLPSVFQIMSTKLLIRYICDIPIHHKENKQAELSEAELTQGPSWYQAELTCFHNHHIRSGTRVGTSIVQPVNSSGKCG